MIDFAAAILLAATFIAAPEQAVSGGRHGIVAASYSVDAVSASNGTTMLLVWHDERGTQAARFEGDRRLDATSIALPIRAEAAFWNGSQWVVVNLRQFVRIDANGNLLDPTPRTLATDTARADVYGAVWVGDAAIVVTGDPDRRELVAWAFDYSMGLMSRTLIAPFGTLGFYWRPAGLVSNGSSALLVYQDEITYDLEGALFNRAGTLVRTRIVDEPNSRVTNAAIGTDGSGFAVVYGIGNFPAKKYTGFTVDTALEARDMGSFDVAPSAGRETAVARNLVFDGTNYTAYFGVWTNNKVDLSAVRIAADGTILDTPTPVTSYSIVNDRFEHPHAQFAGGATALVYAERATTVLSNAKVRIGARVEALSVGPFSQTAPVAASAATQSIVAWRETLAGATSGSVFAARVDPRAVVLDPNSIALESAACADAPMAAASDGRDFLVAWQEASRIAGSLVRADGTAKTFRILQRETGAACTSAAVQAASNGAIYLVVWSASVGEADRDVFAVRVGADGTVLDPLPVTFTTARLGLVQVASDGRDFLVTSGRHAYRISAGGSLLDTGGIRLGGFPLQAWWNGSTYVVALQDEKELGVRFRRIGSDGSGGEAFGEVVPELHPWTQRVPLFSEGAFHCDAGGCEFPVASGGVAFLSRVNDRGDRFTLTTDSVAAPAYPAGDGTPEDLNLADGFLAYSRRLLGEGYASRVFVRRLSAMSRGRAVRH